MTVQCEHHGPNACITRSLSHYTCLVWTSHKKLDNAGCSPIQQSIGWKNHSYKEKTLLLGAASPATFAVMQRAMEPERILKENVVHQVLQCSILTSLGGYFMTLDQSSCCIVHQFYNIWLWGRVGQHLPHTQKTKKTLSCWGWRAQVVRLGGTTLFSWDQAGTTDLFSK